MIDVAYTIHPADAPEQGDPSVGTLETITQEDVPAVIWDRPLPETFQDWIEGLAPAQLPSARVVLKPEDVRACVREACDNAGTPDGPGRDWLVNDVACLADRFARFMATRYLLLRFDAVTNNACRKFHIDAVEARLICTYRGPGTQYGMLNGSEEPQHVFNVPTGAPIILRGTLGPGGSSTDLRHRSPPIAGSGVTRLVVVMDAFREGRDGLSVYDHVFGDIEIE